MNKPPKKANQPDYLKAVRLINIENEKCDFELGRIPIRQHINANYFFAQTDVSTLENIPHPAPRRQYVITLKGKLKFTVTNGRTFTIEPGTILIAADTLGDGHVWEVIEGDEWEKSIFPYQRMPMIVL